MPSGSAISPSVMDRVGDVQSAQGDLAGALKSYRDSLAILEKLAKQDAGNAVWQRDLSVYLWQGRRRAERSGGSCGRAQELPRQPCHSLRS